MSQFPQMGHEHFLLPRRQIKLQFPNIAVFNIVICIDDIIIRLQRKTAVITARQSVNRKQHTAFVSGKRPVIHAVRQQLRPFARRINTNKRMPEQRRRVIHISIGKQQRYPGRSNIGQKLAIFPAFGKAARHQSFTSQISIPRRKKTNFLFIAAGFEQLNRCVQFGLRIRFAFGADKKTGRINSAAITAGPLPAIMSQCQPLAVRS